MRPDAALAAAVTKTSTVSLTFALLGGSEGSLTGHYDSATGLATMSQDSDGDTLLITVGGEDMYLAGLSDFAGLTLHARVGKLDSKSPVCIFADPRGGLTMLAAAVFVQSTGSNRYAGNLDLTKAHGVSAATQKFLAFLLAEAREDRLGAAAFTATIDDQGYVSAFTITLPGVDDGKDAEFTMTFSDFGSSISVPRPSGGKVIEAPASFYTA